MHKCTDFVHFERRWIHGVGVSADATQTHKHRDIYLESYQKDIYQPSWPSAQQLLRWAIIWPQQTWAEKRGVLCPFWGRAGSPSNTSWPRPRSTSVPSGILIHPAIWPQQTWAEKWGCAPFYGSWIPIYTMWPQPRPTSVPSGILIHPAVWPQQTWVENWRLCPFWGELGPHLTQFVWGQGLPQCQVSSWSN